MSTRRIVTNGVFTALMCVLSPLSIPLVGGVPISLATLVVMIMGFFLGRKDGTICVAIYIFIGLIGIPVFSGFKAGVEVLFGITGGYIFGYLPLAYLSGLFNELSINMDTKKKILFQASGMLLGTVVLYAIGTAWFIYYTGYSIEASLAACVLPFIPGDIIKMFVTAILYNRLKK